MANLEIQLRFTQYVGVQPPSAIVWLDLNRDNRYDTHHEGFALNFNNGVASLSKHVDVNVQGMRFLVKYVATPGSKWELTIKSDDMLAFKHAATVVYRESGIVGNLDTSVNWGGGS